MRIGDIVRVGDREVPTWVPSEAPPAPPVVPEPAPEREPAAPQRERVPA